MNITKCTLAALLLTAIVTESSSATFNYSPTSIVPGSGALPDNGCGANNGVTITFNVPDSYTISDVDLGLNVTHTYRGDLVVSLDSPAGSGPNQLYPGDGGVGDLNFNVLFDDSAGVAIPGGDHNTTPLYDNVGEPDPDGNLDSFNGENSLGNWTVFVCDQFAADNGTVTDIELRLTDTAPTFTMNVVKSTPTITNDIAPTGQVSVGDTIEYTVTAINTGTGVLNNVIVVDPLLTPNSNSCATVTSGNTCVLTGSYVVTAADLSIGFISNTATGDSDETTQVNSNTVVTPVTNYFQYEDTTSQVLPDATNTTTTNTCSSAGVTPVNIVFNISDNFTVADLNVGFMATTPNKRDIDLYLTSPASTTVELFSDVAGGNPNDNFNILMDSDAPSNQMGGDHAIPGGGNYDLLTTPETANALDAFDGENSVGAWTLTMCDDRQGNATNYLRSLLQFDGVATDSLDVTKSLTSNTDADGNGVVSETDVLTFTITATNTGTSPQTNVIVSDPLLTPNSNSCANVAVGATCSLVGTYIVTAADRESGSFSNTGSALSDQVGATSSNTVISSVDAQITVVKAQTSYVDNDVNGYISVGDVLNYTVTANNTGPNVNILVTDPILSPNSASCLNVNTGASCVLSGTYLVLAQDKLAGNILNTGTASLNGVRDIESNTVHTVVGENSVADAESVFYMPLPEDDALASLQSIFPDPAGGASPISGETCGASAPPVDPISTYSSITVLRSNTLIYYDHWEDDYEVAPNASAQGTTEVWGDGDLSNGFAPGSICSTDSCDVLQAGTIIILDNQIDSSNLLAIDFDGGDKISATDTIAMTKANWSTGPDTLLAGAFELYPTTEWGTSYELPVGQDVFVGNNAKYQYVGFTVMAQANGTTVDIDADGDGIVELSFTLNEGESRYIDANDPSIPSVLIGATVTASDLVQVDIVTGDICANYEARFITLFPTELWDSSYYNPVGTGAGDGAPVRTLLYNPDHSNALTVLVIDSFGSTTVTVPAGGVVDYLQNSDTAARYCTTIDNTSCDNSETARNFYAIAAVDADPDSATGQTSLREDWGLTLVPTSSLSQQALLGLGFGQDPLLPVTENSSPVWVTADLVGGGTPTGGIQLCVDYDNDGTDTFFSATPLIDPVTGQEYDERFSVDPYERSILYDYDGDQTSMLIWVCEDNALDAANAVIAAAWGQDPAVSSGGAPAVDVGTGIPNVSSIILLKEGELTNDLNGDGFPSIGDTIRYKISLTNIGFVPVSPGAVLTDTLPSNVDYVENSTLYFNSITTMPILDDNVPTSATTFPLDEAGVSLNDLLAVGNSFLITFDVIVASLPPADVEICNNADINVPFESVTDEFCIEIVPRSASIGDLVWNDLDSDGLQDPGEPGIEGVTVTLVDIGGNTVLDGLSNPITTTTAADGSWTFNNLAIGNYRVLFDTSTSTDGLPYILTSPNQGADDTLDSDGQANGNNGESLTSLFALSENETDLTIDAGFLQSSSNSDPELCYSIADDGDRLITVNPISGETDDLAPGLGSNAPFVNIETAEWDIGDPIVAGDETLFGINENELIRMIPSPRASIGVFDTGVLDVDGMAIDWQSIPPVHYGAASLGASGFRQLFTFNPANANVINLSPLITLPAGTNKIDDLAWDPLNRRLLGVANQGVNNGRIIEFEFNADLSSVTAHDCGPVQYFNGVSNVELHDLEGMTMNRPGELFISTGDNSAGGAANSTRNGLWKVVNSNIPSDCSTTTSSGIQATNIGPDNALATVPSGNASNDHEAIACGVSFSYSNASIGNRVWLDEDANGLQSGGEDGIGDVTVYLCRSNASPCDVSTAIRTEITDANGGYLFEGIPIMDYIVAVDTSTLPANLATNATFDEDDGTVNPDSETFVTLNRFEHEHLTADFGYNWNDSPETETPPPGTQGSIGDRVWNDSNGNGIQDANEIGINTVDILLYSDPDNNGVFDTFVASTVTDNNGNYVFDGLPVGAYVVEVVPSSLPVGINWTQTGDPDDFAQLANNPDNMTSSPVILAPGDVFVNADFGYQGDAVNTHDIGDTVYLDANANGTEDVGEPGIENVTLSLIDSVGNTIARTTSDNNGNYLFPGLPDGDYTVVVTDIDNILGEKYQTGDPDGVIDYQSRTTVAGSDVLTLDFGFAPEGHTNGEGLIGDTIFLDINGTGGQDSGETGIEGVKVELISVASGFPLAFTLTDENGNYQFGELSAGDYTVRVDTTTLPGGGVGMVNSFDPDATTANESDVTLAAGEINLDQDFGYTVTVPNIISGTLWNDEDADGTLEGSESTRFAGITIDLLDPLGNIMGSTVTDASGNYQFTGLPDGTYIVSVTDESNLLAGHWLTDGPTEGADSNSQVVDYTVTVSGGSTNTTADFGYYSNLSSIGNVIFRDDNFDGVRDPAIEPGIPNVPVTLTITYPNTDTLTLTVFTDEFGQYSFNNLLADDSYTGDDLGGTDPQPTYNIVVGSLGAGYISSYKGVADATGIGNGTDDNSDNSQGEIAFPVKGGQDFTNDFGYTPAAVIGNRVWLDLDNDGVQDANEDGLSNRIVSLTPPPGIDLGNGAGIAITTITDNEGEYIFPKIPVASGYQVTVTNPPSGLTQSYDEDGTGTAHTSNVDLTTGNQEYLTADFGYAPSSGSIGDFIWSDVNGDGVQDTHEIGISGVTVELFNQTDGVSVGTTVTDTTGHYLFTGQPLDKTFEVRITSGVPAGYTQTGDPDGTLDALTQVPSLQNSNGFNLAADFGYQPPAANHADIGDTVYIDLNGDGTQDPGEPGVEGVTIHLLIDTDADNVPDTAIGSTETDSNGNYLFPSLPESEDYGVVVTDTSNILNNYQQTDDPDVFFDGQSTVLNLTGDDLDQDFGYVPKTNNTGVIGDFIFNNINGDGVQDAGEPGLEGVRVNLYLASSGNLLDSILTDENGEYLFTGLDPNESYDIVIDQNTLPGGPTAWTSTFDPDGAPLSESSVDLSIIPSGISLDQDFGYTAIVQNIIGGTVWQESTADGLLTDGSSGTDDETSNGIANVRLLLRDSNGDVIDRQFTDINGDYQFSGLPDGTYSVEVDDVNNILSGVNHTDGPNPGNDNNSQDDTGYIVSVAGGSSDFTGDFGYAPIVLTPITLSSFQVMFNSEENMTTINWTTVSEVGQVGFILHYKENGQWVQLRNKIVAAKGINSEKVHRYELNIPNLRSHEWRLVDVDIFGKYTVHGPFSEGMLYGEEPTDNNVINWSEYQNKSKTKAESRKAERARRMNEYIQVQKQLNGAEQ